MQDITRDGRQVNSKKLYQIKYNYLKGKLLYRKYYELYHPQLNGLVVT